ncbi:MAG: 3-phosphoshikimate 1-carboxyvinyltransferase, partial [Chloroflexi bacterium]|nr:3-phosphoshikimate 1-carboxyvinyltransferase [Chloroflexota bacterium]
SSALQGTRVGGPLVVRMIDEFPAFAIAAAYAQGETVVADAEELRHKESDRIGKLCQELRLLGVEVEEKPDGFVIHGRPPLHGATVQSHGDHRLAMALSVAGLGASTELTVEGAEIIAESFPQFSQCLQALGAELRQA